MGRGTTGTNTGSLSVSPARARAYGRKRRAEEKRWAAKSGPVTVRYDPSIKKP